MADIYTSQKRSQIMAGVRGSGNRVTELRLIAIFRASSITGWRRKYPLFGRPDFTFPKQHLTMFVDGCFWHGCPKHNTRPSSNRLFWNKKLERNISRDRLVNMTLRKNGWHVVRVWQHELTKTNEQRLVMRLRKQLGKKMGIF